MTFDVAGNAARAVHDRSAAWRFIEGFAAAWAEPLEPQDGWNRADLAATEERLGVGLPEAVKEALSLFGKRPDLTSNQDRLLTPTELRLDGGILVFRDENQWVAAWGTTLDGDDPEVLIKLDLVDKTGEHWDTWLPRFSLACVEMVLSEALFRDGAETADREMSEMDTSLLQEHFAELPLHSPGTRWFVSDDVIVREDDSQWLWARARTPEALELLAKQLPGDWTTEY
ncbi:SMI1/KNR4 family protein [Lentzea sp. PSKA42]|uniref:SMI1/KNR4 family protein n=1 Tax=Lentzea indica TaxID=2604800 RepID=A0ABX1FXM2_9PSEU|nr:SMI1/KNR4 family protein [Lentzea indica]NKE63196.1 SMI1/KNR4 family protein [Lentzea indica]